MRIATLQFAPKVGDVEGNIKRTNELLNSGYATGIESLKPDLLVLPELALTGEYQYLGRGSSGSLPQVLWCGAPIPIVDGDMFLLARVQFPLARSHSAVP